MNDSNVTINPLTRLDYPDVDVIRVDDTYYMVSTTMYFMPGCEILRSYDLVHWEHAAYVYDRLDSTPDQCLEGTGNIYGQGMWAASLRYHDGTFYVCFVCNDTHKTYLYRSKSITGPWEKSIIDGFYHDNSILFDDDGRVYIVSGNREIWLTELDSDFKGPKEGGIHKVILRDDDDAPLGYEGSHLYKINGRYYLFTIHIPKATGRRTEACHMATSIDGEYIGRDICDDTHGLGNSGIAQGGIVETPGGKWYAILFQDSGAVGRIPFLMPVTWVDDMPVIGDNGIIPDDFQVEDNRPGYEYTPLVSGDDFTEPEFKSCWQFNHEPDLSLITHDCVKKTVSVKTGKISRNLVQAQNTLTQRCSYPGGYAEVTLDASGLGEGDYAGLCLLESNYAFIAVTRRDGRLFLVMHKRTLETESFWGERHDDQPAAELECIPIEEPVITLRADTDFSDMRDEGSFSYRDREGVLHLMNEPVKLKFMLDHFTGVRYGLFVFSTMQTGGTAVFSDFRRE